jgi:hypothetical protein
LEDLRGSPQRKTKHGRQTARRLFPCSWNSWRGVRRHGVTTLPQECGVIIPLFVGKVFDLFS